MFIVKHRNDLVRFLVFLLLVGGMAMFVFQRAGAWMASEEEAPVVDALAAPSGAQATEVLPLLPDEDGEDYFADARIHREQIRARYIEHLQDLMASSEGEVRKEAEAQYLQMGRAANLEANAEQLVMARGFSDVVVHMSEGSAQVVVKAPRLTQPEATQIIELVSRVTGVKQSMVSVQQREK